VFLRGGALPEPYRGAALVALHGSWNRTRKDGYKVVSLHWGADGTIREEDFLVGFLEDEDVIGRPVDVAEGPDGTIFVSDDYAGAVYRVTQAGVAAAARVAASLSAEGADPLAALDPTQRSARAARGQQHWEALGCAGCHLPEQAAPGVIPVVLRELGRRHDLAGMTGFLATPTPPMPAVALDESDRSDLAVYVLDRFR
jgi:hypothetical protein